MKLKLLPSSFEEDGSPSCRQHLTSIVVNDLIAFDAGSLAMAATADDRKRIRDIVISHAHLDHVAGLPLFIDDLFSTLDEPIRIHVSSEVKNVLEEHIFNWSIYPRFSELQNDFGPVAEYRTFEPGQEFSVAGLSILAIEVNHKVPSCGFVISAEGKTVAMTGDTAPTEVFWRHVNSLKSVDAVLIECAFPNELADLAEISHHLTPGRLDAELRKLDRSDCQIFIANIKPVFRDRTVTELEALGIGRLNILEVGREYEW